MSYPVSSSLLDGIVLAVVERESTYGCALLRQHRIDWQNYRNGIDSIFFGG